MPYVSTSTYTMEGPCFSNDDLKQYSKKSRCFMSDLHGPTITTCTFNLPLVILHSFWIRHHLSRKDSQMCIDFVPAQYMWLLALLHGIDSSASSIKPSFASDTSLLVSSKAIAVRKIIKKLKFEFCNTDKISPYLTSSLNHVPGIPSHFVKKSLYSMFSKSLVPTLDIFKITTIPSPIKFLDVLWIPRRFEGSAICCNRITLKTTFDDSGKYINKGLATKSYIMTDGMEFFCCLEEAILLICE